MTNVSIDELLDIGDSQASDAVAAVHQDGITFKARKRPNPPRQINVTTQAQLESEFGSDIEIPDGQSFLINIDENMTLTKPIKIGLGSAVRIVGAVSSISLTYTGTGAMFQNTNPANAIDSFDIRLIRIAGNLTNNAFDLVGGVNSFFFVNTVQIIQFIDVGFVDIELVELQSLGMFANIQGLTIKDPAATSINVVVVDQTGLGITDMTAFSFIQSQPTLVILDDVRAINISAGESLVFFDPNAPVGASFVLTNATKTLGNLFQPGIDIVAPAIGAGAGSSTDFDIDAHGLVVGQTVVLKGFTTFTSYNGTFRVTAVNSVNSVDIGVPFAGSEAGTMSAKSLDNTDVLVSSFNNPMEPDSMFTAESGYEDSGSPVTLITTIGVPEIIVNTNYGFSNLERFAEGITNEGQIITLDAATRRYSVSYSGSITKGGSSAIMGVVLLKNGVLAGFNPPMSPDVNAVQSSGINIIELTGNDTLQVGVVNYSSLDSLQVTHVDLVVNRA